MNNKPNRKKATLHVSIEPALSERLRAVCETMGLPVSHFASLALSREVARFEAEFQRASPGKAARNA